MKKATRPLSLRVKSRAGHGVRKNTFQRRKRHKKQTGEEKRGYKRGLRPLKKILHIKKPTKREGSGNSYAGFKRGKLDEARGTQISADQKVNRYWTKNFRPYGIVFREGGDTEGETRT